MKTDKTNFTTLFQGSLKAALEEIVISLKWVPAHLVNEILMELWTKFSETFKYHFGCLDPMNVNFPQEFGWQICLFWAEFRHYCLIKLITTIKLTHM